MDNKFKNIPKDFKENIDARIGSIVSPKNIFRPLTDLSQEYAVIDENIVSAIRFLNSKGYVTYYCCEGHVNECSTSLLYLNNGDMNRGCDFYVVIKNTPKIMNSIRKESLPEGFYYETTTCMDMKGNIINCIAIRSIWNGVGEFDLSRNKLKILLNFYDWVESLENLKRKVKENEVQSKKKRIENS